MKNLKEIQELIKTYDKMINDLVESNAPDKVIGNLELKRQKLISKREKLQTNNTSTILVEKEEVQVSDKKQDNHEIEKLYGDKSVIEKVSIIAKLNDEIKLYDSIIENNISDIEESKKIIDMRIKTESLIEELYLLLPVSISNLIKIRRKENQYNNQYL